MRNNLEKMQSAIAIISKNKDVESVESIFSLSGVTDPNQLIMAVSQPNSPLTPLVDQFVADNKMRVNVYLKNRLTTERKTRMGKGNGRRKTMGCKSHFRW